MPTPARPGPASAPPLLRGAFTTPTHAPPHPVPHTPPQEGRGRQGRGRAPLPGPLPRHLLSREQLGASRTQRAVEWRQALPCPQPHLNGHVGAVSIKVIVLPVKGDVVAAPVDGTGAVAHGLGARPAPFPAGAEESQKGAWKGCRAPPPSAAHKPHPPKPSDPGPCPDQSPTSQAGASGPWDCSGPLRGPRGRAGRGGLSPGVAVHPDPVPGGVQVLVVHTRARLLHHAAAPAIVNQALRAHAAADALCLVLGAGGRVGSGMRCRPRVAGPSSDTEDTPAVPLTFDLSPSPGSGALPLQLTTGLGDR